LNHSTESTPTHKIVDVAVGLIVQDGKALLAQRAAHQHQGGRYEFPGGKVEAGEPVTVALARELHEELGIDVIAPHFVQRLTYHYPEKTVCLHVYRIDTFSGEPIGREGQPLSWVALDVLFDLNFPDANRPIVRAAQLPSHYVITPALWMDGAEEDRQAAELASLPAWLAEQAMEKDTDAWLYVRLPNVLPVTYAAAIQQLSMLRPDLHLIAASDALDSVNEYIVGRHLTQSALLATTQLTRASERDFWFAACHDAASIQHAISLGVDAVMLGSVLETPTHIERAPLGWDGFAMLAAQSDVPVYAIGGMTPAHLGDTRARGGFGVAGIRFL
jgi:8-oxo-dGTP diphosphatase